MARSWSQVAQNPAYQALPPDQQEAARQQYFQQVVAPQLPDDNARSMAKTQFDQQTGPGSTPFGQGVMKAVQEANAQDSQPQSLGNKALNAIYEFGTAEGHHLGNAALGLGQLVGHGVNAAAQAVLPQDSELRQQIAGTVKNADANIAAREKAYQAEIPNSAASYAGATAGEIAPWLLEAPAKGLQAVSNLAKYIPESLPLVRRIASGALQGGAIAATQPVTDTTSDGGIGSLITGAPTYAQEKLKQVGLGSLTGGAIPVATSAIGAVARPVGNLGRYLFNPQSVAGENLARNIGSSPEVLAQLDAASNPNATKLAGTRLTSAQAAPSPASVATEKAFGNTAAGKEALTQRANENNAQRVGILRDLAGDDASYQQALNDRANAVLDNGQKLSDYQKTTLPATQVDPSSVLALIDKIKNSGLGARPTIASALDSIANTIKSRTGDDGKISADVLDSIRQNANDFLVSPTGKQASAQEKAGVQPIKSKIIDAIDSTSPGYRNYLATFADKSTPINTMDAARDIVARVDKRSLNSAGAAPLSLNDINQGLAKIERGRYGVSQDAQDALDAIQESLKREGVSNSIRSPGSDTAYNLQASGKLPSALLGPNLQGPTTKTRLGAAGLGALIGEHFGGGAGATAGAALGAFVNKGADIVNNRIMEQYAKGVLNPQDAATLIRGYLAGNKDQASRLLSKYPQWNALLSSQASKQPQNVPPATQGN